VPSNVTSPRIERRHTATDSGGMLTHAFAAFFATSRAGPIRTEIGQLTSVDRIVATYNQLSGKYKDD